LTGLAEKGKKRREVERETADTIILMPVTGPFPFTPRHTRHTDRGYAMPHRENHDFNFLHPTRKPTKAGRELAYNNRRFWHYWKAACVTAHLWTKVTGSQRLQRDGEWKQNPRAVVW
jgi:hypothetical protein